MGGIRLAAALATAARLVFRLAILGLILSLIDISAGTNSLESVRTYLAYPAELAEQAFSGPDTAGRITAFFTAMAVVASIIIGSIQVYQSNKVARATKTIDVVMHSAVRYNELSDRRPEPRRKNVSREALGKEIHTWHSTYWGLKNDQFDYWLMGFFDHDTFCDWSSSIYKYFWRDAPHLDLTRHPDLLVGRIDYENVRDSFADSWMRYRNGVNGAVNPRFVDFIDQLALNVIYYHDLVEARKDLLSKEELERTITRVWDLLFAEMIGLVYVRYIDKPGAALRLWGSYVALERRVLGAVGVADLFGLVVRSGFGDRWRRDTIRGMTWQRYTQSLAEDSTFTREVYKQLMRGVREEARIVAELFTCPAAPSPKPATAA